MESLWKSTYKNFDLILFAAVVILVVLGLSTIQSTVVAGSPGNQILTENLFHIQLLAVGVGLGIFAGLLFFDYRYLAYFSVVLYLIVILGLGLVLLWGQPVRGATRWFELGSFNLQPSTIGMIGLTTAFAAFFAVVKEKINQFRYLAVAVMLVLPPFVLILLEPDLGAALVTGLVWLGLLHLTPIRISRLAAIYGLILIAALLVWQNLATYQFDRLTSFLDPERDPLGTSYNALQSMIAIGSGQWLGRGWGQGTQSHLQFLPEHHTDFIFATFAEEQGFIGSLIVSTLYGLVIWRGLIILRSTRDYFGQLLTAGVLIWLTINIMLNIAMNSGIAPVTGVPLPFVSYGGTMMITTWIAVGLIESVAIRRN